MQQKTIRKTQLTLIFGVNGAGKTTFIKEKIIPCLQKSFVVTPYLSEWTELPIVSTPQEIYNLQGAARLIYKSPADFDNIRQYFYGGNRALIESVLQQFTLDDTLDFFAELGLWTTKENGKLVTLDNVNPGEQVIIKISKGKIKAEIIEACEDNI